MLVEGSGLLVSAIFWFLCWLVVGGEGCSRIDGGWLPARTGSSTNVSCTSVVEFLMLVFTACNGSSSGDDVSNVRSVVVSNGGGGATF